VRWSLFPLGWGGDANDPRIKESSTKKGEDTRVPGGENNQAFWEEELLKKRTCEFGKTKLDSRPRKENEPGGVPTSGGD